MISRTFSRGNNNIEPNISYQEASGHSVNIRESNINVIRNVNKKKNNCGLHKKVFFSMYTVLLHVPQFYILRGYIWSQLQMSVPYYLFLLIIILISIQNNLLNVLGLCNLIIMGKLVAIAISHLGYMWHLIYVIYTIKAIVIRLSHGMESS